MDWTCTFCGDPKCRPVVVDGISRCPLSLLTVECERCEGDGWLYDEGDPSAGYPSGIDWCPVCDGHGVVTPEPRAAEVVTQPEADVEF